MVQPISPYYLRLIRERGRGRGEGKGEEEEGEGRKEVGETEEDHILIFVLLYLFRCDSSQLKHLMEQIRPQFQRDFISLLPKEVCIVSYKYTVYILFSFFFFFGGNGLSTNFCEN